MSYARPRKPRLTCRGPALAAPPALTCSGTQALVVGIGGEGWIRTTEGLASRFTVCPLWPLGNLTTHAAATLESRISNPESQIPNPKSAIRNPKSTDPPHCLEPAGGFGPPTPGLQNRCSAIELRRPRLDLQDEAVYRRYRHFQEAIARKTAAAPGCVETSSNGFNAETAEDNRENTENNDGQILFQETTCLCGLSVVSL